MRGPQEVLSFEAADESAESEIDKPKENESKEKNHGLSFLDSGLE